MCVHVHVCMVQYVAYLHLHGVCSVRSSRVYSVGCIHVLTVASMDGGVTLSVMSSRKCICRTGSPSSPHLIPTPHPHTSSPHLIPTPHPHTSSPHLSTHLISTPHPHTSSSHIIPTPHPHTSSPHVSFFLDLFPFLYTSPLTFSFSLDHSPFLFTSPCAFFLLPDTATPVINVQVRLVGDSTPLEGRVEVT